uniref:Uncharacterized protein n=1 Tax=Rhizophora mucronata TaxID=61149 RepID=A0A2P2LAW4_RHIMU
MLVDVDLRSSPVLHSTLVTNQEATESRMLHHEGVLEYGLNSFNIHLVFHPDCAVDDGVQLRPKEEPAGRRHRIFGGAILPGTHVQRRRDGFCCVIKRFLMEMDGEEKNRIFERVRKL